MDSKKTLSKASNYVNAERLQSRLDTLAKIGATSKGGVNRQALSKEDAMAQVEMTKWATELGLKAYRDDAGNFFIRYEGKDSRLPPVFSGSHLDSQPTGGRFDGVFGVVAAFEAVQALIDAGLQPQHSIDVVAWMNEEGSRFAPGMMGSSVFSGDKTLADIHQYKDVEGVTVHDALIATKNNIDACIHKGDIPAIGHRPIGAELHAYLEAHIEQGPVLERKNLSVGIVTGIQGKHTWRIEVIGEASHAGTSTRAERKDALLAAMDMVQAMTRAFHDEADITKFTVGRFDVTPSAPSVVPSKVIFSIDLRHPDTELLQKMSQQVETLCVQHKGVCDVNVHHLSGADSLIFPEKIQQCLLQVTNALDIPTMTLPSAAGHDARYLHYITPSGMLFAPCHLGITHNEAEFAKTEDLYKTTQVLADALYLLASE